MFKPGEIEAIPLPIEHQFYELEDRVMIDIIRRLKANGFEITRSADWQINRLYELGKSKAEIRAYIARVLTLSDEDVDKIYSDVVKDGYARNESLYKATGNDFIPFADNIELQHLISVVEQQTKGELINITQSLGFITENGAKSSLTDYYQKTLDAAMYDISTGLFDYNTVLKRTVKEMTNSGLRRINYESGWSNRVPVAARRAVMTGFSQVTAKMNEDVADNLGTDDFEVSYHTGARPTHQKWQGRVYSKKELYTICGLDTVTGLCGANCYHDYNAFVKGVSTRTYTDEQLDRMNREENTPKTYKGKEYARYEALQRQRQLETNMRAERQTIKLLQEGGAGENDIIIARANYRATSAEYTNFSKEMGLIQQRERVTVDGLGNIGIGKYTK